MSLQAFEDLEIVGFDGTVLIECEMVLPIARNKTSDLYFKLTNKNSNEPSERSSSTEQRALFTRAEIKAYEEEGRLTLLREPFLAFGGAMVAYFNHEVLEAANTQIPEMFQIQVLSDDVWVACDTQERIECLFNQWATQIMNNATTLLEQFFITGDKQLIELADRMTDLALCAANDITLRARIYLRSGLAIMFSELPESIDNIYQLTIRHEFPNWTWEAFQTRLVRLSEILATRASLKASSSQTETEGMPKVIELSNVTSEIVDFEERFVECEINAEEYRQAHPIDEDLIEKVSRLITASSQMRLENNIAHALAGDPLFYYLGRSLFIARDNWGRKNFKNNLIQTDLYLKTAREIMAKGYDPGRVATLAVTKYVVVATYV